MSGIYKLPEYAQHPIAIDLMPSTMPADEFEAFCEDVKEKGVLMPVWLYEDKIIDGWHRYRAAKKTGSAPEFREYKGKDPAGFVASCNVHRRKLSSLQRALVGAKLHLNHSLTQRQVCKRLGISNEVLSMVVKAVESKVAKIIKRIEIDSDFSRGQLREELTDAGLLRAKPEPQVDPGTVANSVFQLASKPHAPPPPPVLGEGAYAQFADAVGASDPDEDDEPEGDPDVDELLDDAPSLAAEKRRAKKPRETAVQAAVDTFKALREEEQRRFLTAIWPLARKLAAEDTTWLNNLLPLAPTVGKLAPTNKPAPAPGKGATPAPGKPPRPGATPAPAPRKPAPDRGVATRASKAATAPAAPARGKRK